MTARRIAILLACAALGACQPGWVRLDGARPGDAELAQARARCKVDQRLAALEQAQAAAGAGQPAINSNEARMQRIDDLAAMQRRVYRQIDTCMERGGLRRS